ncbi:MAG: hypothetical protein QOE96_3421 [Blastocatellia bacterium]|nr:hypothetical protein [Blastocatellia bacterium]
MYPASVVLALAIVKYSSLEIVTSKHDAPFIPMSIVVFDAHYGKHPGAVRIELINLSL